MVQPVRLGGGARARAWALAALASLAGALLCTGAEAPQRTASVQPELGAARPSGEPRHAAAALGVVELVVVAAEGGAMATQRGTCTASDPGCVARAGAPVARASVRAFCAESDTYRLVTEVATDELGRARLEAPLGAVWLLVEAAGRARRTQLVELAEAVSLRVELPAAAPLVVEVRDERARPVAGATVLVEDGDALPHGALTSELGIATLDGVGADVERVRASAPGHLPTTGVASSGRASLTLGTPASLDVHVEGPAGQPAAGARVWIAGVDVWPPRLMVADSAGLAHWDGLASGVYDVRAEHEAAVALAPLAVSLARGERAELSLELEPGREVRVRLTDGDAPDAKPVPGAELVLIEEGSSPFALRGTTDAAGRHEFGPVSKRPAIVNVRAPGFMPENGVHVAPDRDELQIALVRSARVTGTVLDPEGRPVAGATLEIEGHDARGRPLAGNFAVMSALTTPESSLLPLVPLGELGVMRGPLPVPGATPLAPPPSGAWLSDLDGQYELRDVPPGRVRVLARHPDFLAGTSELTELAPGSSADVQVSLRPGAVLEGHVTDAEGAAVRGARIDVIAAAAGVQQSAITRADGTFVLRALPPSVELMLARPGERQRFILRRTFELEPGQRRSVELVLPRERPPLSVVVTDEEEEPVAGATVALSSLDPDVPLRESARTDAHGEARLGDAAGLDATLRVQAEGLRPFEARVDGAADRVEVRLVRGTAVRGRVTHVRGRQNLSGAEVVLLQGGDRRVTRSRSDGEFDFADVSVGPARLVISHPDVGTQTRDVTVLATGRPDRAFELEPIDMPDAGRVRGRVVDAEGSPVRGARVGVGLVPAYVPLGPLPSGLTETAADGSFVLEGVPAGDATLSAYAAGLGRGSASGVDVRAQDTTVGVEIQLHGAAEADDEDDVRELAGNLAITLGERRDGADTSVVIVNVAKGSVAERAGVRGGDVLLAVDGVDVASMLEARHALSGAPGSEVLLELERGIESILLRVRREPVRR